MRFKSLLGVTALLLAGSMLVVIPSVRAAPARGTSRPIALHAQSVCGQLTGDNFECLSNVLVNALGRPFSTGVPNGWGPADLQDAYKLPSATKGAGQTVAIIDAFDDPNAESDLAVYRQQYGLPPCTTGNGCFKKVDQRGGNNYPVPNGGWAVEMSLDLDMVSAICPNCHILLVEADLNHGRPLGHAVNESIRLGAKQVSNSYGGRQKRKEAFLDETFFKHDGIAITASSGDGGYGVIFPAASRYVTAVGGTVLSKGGGGSRGWTETAWSGAGSGCAMYESKRLWQKDTGCGDRRTVADVSAVAWGVAVYDTYLEPGWIVVGGTSVSSPIIASVYALAGGTAHYGSDPYLNPPHLFDITTGANGSCSPKYLCTGGPGYDGPTGLGTPDGVKSFL